MHENRILSEWFRMNERNWDSICDENHSNDFCFPYLMIFLLIFLVNLQFIQFFYWKNLKTWLEINAWSDSPTLTMKYKKYWKSCWFCLHLKWPISMIFSQNPGVSRDLTIVKFVYDDSKLVILMVLYAFEWSKIINLVCCWLKTIIWPTEKCYQGDW